MKFFFNSFLLFALLSCGESSLETEMQKAISNATNVKVSAILIKDTVTVLDLDSAIINLDHEIALYHKIQMELPTRLAYAESELAKINSTEYNDPTLAYGKKRLKEDWLEIIQSINERREMINRQLKLARNDLNFTHSAYNYAKGEVAYYLATTMIRGDEVAFNITPDMQIIQSNM